MDDAQRTQALIQEASRLRYSRRQILRRAAALGLSAGGIGMVLAACGGAATTTSSTTSATASSAGVTATTAPAVVTKAPAVGGTTATAAGGSTPAAGAGSATPASTTGVAGLPSGFKGGGSLSLLLRAHFVPEFDQWFDKFAEDWGKKNNVKVTVDHIQAGQLGEKIAAEVAAKAGHDVLQLTRAGEAYLFATSLQDVSDFATAIGQAYGGWQPQAEKLTKINGVWKAVPDYHLSYPTLYRKDLFDEVKGNPTGTWEELIAIGAQLKAKDHPFGFPINQKSNDANSTWLGFLWSHGASYVGEDGKTVAFKSDQTLQALKVAVELYNKTMTEEVLSWDDSGNNRFLASGRGSMIINPISALASIEKDNADLAKNIFVARPPRGPKGSMMSAAVGMYAVTQWSKSAEAAKALLAAYYNQWLDAFKASKAFNHPFLGQFLKKPMPILGENPKLEVLQTANEWTVFTGYPGPPTPAAGEVEENWIIPLTIGKAVQTGNAQEAMDWGYGKIAEIYQRHNK